MIHIFFALGIFIGNSFQFTEFSYSFGKLTHKPRYSQQKTITLLMMKENGKNTSITKANLSWVNQRPKIPTLTRHRRETTKAPKATEQKEGWIKDRRQ